MNALPTDLDLCYVATHGFAVRMVFQTGLLGQLAARGLRVGVIVPDAQDQNLVELCRRDGVVPIAYPCSPAPAARWLKSLRKYVVEDIRRNPCLWDKHQEVLAANARRPHKKMAATLGLLINDVVEQLPILRRWFLAAEQRLLLRSEVVAFLRQLGVRTLVATYPVAAPEPELLLAARALGLQTVLHLLSWDNITAKGHFQALADHYLTWGPTMEEELQQFYGVAPDRMTRCGVPHFDLYFQPPTPVESPLLQQLAGGRPYLFFAMSAARYAPGETAILAQLCEATVPGGALAGVRIVARPHPSALAGVMRDTATLDALRRLENTHGLLVSLPQMVAGSRMNWSVQDSDMHELVGLLRGAAVVLNSGSTVAVEALALGRPVVITSYDGPENRPYAQSARRLRDYPHLAKLIGDGGGAVVESHTALLAQITTLLAAPETGAEARAHALFRQIGDQDGKATERVVAALVRALPQVPGTGQGAREVPPPTPSARA
ncbi:hypothetical protein QWY85_18695 [Neolewinella lacunae]|uniref:Uncharacterized protein n=1 Tax=Neolewinella lacunae TaxID=1517758 RepID=A0A923PP75_9BACT|nr:hypothetical protein [Neolewinella lacunae]MBC6994147.1 hypothetical protein [Neolewinella lacunae]MDN3636704.1 hypothetical protein [Neolewinella lacunae]